MLEFVPFSGLARCLRLNFNKFVGYVEFMVEALDLLNAALFAFWGGGGVGVGQVPNSCFCNF